MSNYYSSIAGGNQGDLNAPPRERDAAIHKGVTCVMVPWDPGYCLGGCGEWLAGRGICWHCDYVRWNKRETAFLFIEWLARLLRDA